MINENKLKELRIKRKLNQLELAETIKVSVEEIGLLERNKIHNPRLKTLLSLANYFDVSIDWLCNRDNINYLSRFEQKIIRLYRENKFAVESLEKAVEHYENPTELSNILREIHSLVPYMDLEIAKSVLKLLTSSVTK